MKNIFILTAFLSISILGSCSDASTAPTKKEFPTYKHSFTGKISNPKNYTIPDDAYFAIVWSISRPNPDYAYIYGDGYIDKATNTFTIGFNDDLPTEAMNLNDTTTGGLGVAEEVLLITSPKKYSGKLFTEAKDIKLYGLFNWKGMIYIGGDPSKVEWRSWAKDFKSGYNFAQAVKANSGFDYFIPAEAKDMELTIDTVASNYTMPNWTGINPHNSNIR